MMPFEGDFRLNSEMILGDEAFRNAADKETVWRANKGSFSRSEMDLLAFASLTSSLFLATILSNMFICN